MLLQVPEQDAATRSSSLPQHQGLAEDADHRETPSLADEADPTPLAYNKARPLMHPGVLCCNLQAAA